MIKELTVNLAPAYSLWFADNLLQTSILVDFLKQRREHLVILTDSNLANAYAKQVADHLAEHGLNCEILFFPAGEQYKTRETKALLEDQLLQKQYGRDTCLIAIGGGVVTDLVGFIAATYCRGVSAIYLPTSLVAMVDASIGGKTAVDTPYGKNLIGAFYQPRAVFFDISALQTLSDFEYTNGMVEVIKHALIADKELFNQLNDQRDTIMTRQSALLLDLIYRNCNIKRTIVEQDEFDHGMRHLLNFGHTIGHAIETIENYRLSHGEAVAIGMIVESYLSLLMGFLSAAEFEKILSILHRYQLPLQTRAFSDLAHFKKVLILDKKNQAKKPYFVLLDAIGKAHIHGARYSMPVPEAMLDQALQWAAKYSR